MMKRLIISAFIISLMASTSVSNAAETLKIMVLNESLKSDAAPIMEQGRVLVPLRSVAESLGATVDWDPKTKTATVRKWSEVVRFTVGRNTALVKKTNPLSLSDRSGPVALDVSVKSVNNRIYIPMRFVSQLFGYQVNWSNHTVFIHLPLSDGDWKTLHKGNLALSRKLAIKLTENDVHYRYEPLVIDNLSEDYTRTFLFPEGESLRFYYIFRNTVSFLEFENGFPVVIWQAHIPAGDPIQRFVEGDFTDRQGTEPTINNTFLYYSVGMSGESNTMLIGSVDSNGMIIRLGYKREMAGEVTEESGTTVLELPDEKRVETVSE